MSDIFRDCENCEIRKAIAKRFDLHWMGEDDCPFACPYEEEETHDERIRR